MDYKTVLYSETFLPELRYLIYNYLEPIYLSFEIRNSLPKYGHIIKRNPDNFKRYIEKRMIGDFIVSTDDGGKNGRSHSLKESDIREYQNEKLGFYLELHSSDEFIQLYKKFIAKKYDMFLLYHYFSLLTVDFNQNPPLVSKLTSRYVRGRFIDEEYYENILTTLFNFKEINNQQNDRSIIYGKSIYSRDELLKILTVLVNLESFYLGSCIGAHGFEMFERDNIMLEFIELILEQKPNFIAKMIHNLKAYKSDNSKKYLYFIFQKIMRKDILLEVIQFADFDYN